MALKQRAIAVADKEVRAHAILDAFEALYLEHPDRMASVAEVAEAAGMGKGTVYLYFPSKEEMLLALHERHVAGFFARLMQRLEEPGKRDFDEVFAITRDYLIRVPGCLALTSRCFGMMDREMPIEVAVAFKARVATTVATAGAALERHLALGSGGGIRLLMHSYGMIVGLWQLLHPNERFGQAMDTPELRPIKLDYEREIERALRALWAGTLDAAKPQAAPARKSR